MAINKNDLVDGKTPAKRAQNFLQKRSREYRLRERFQKIEQRYLGDTRRSLAHLPFMQFKTCLLGYATSKTKELFFFYYEVVYGNDFYIFFTFIKLCDHNVIFFIARKEKIYKVYQILGRDKIINTRAIFHSPESFQASSTKRGSDRSRLKARPV